MSKPIEGCPQPETPIRDRAWTAEQVERAAEQLCVRSRDDLDAERMLRAYAAALRQQAERGDGAVVSMDAISMLVHVLRERGWPIREMTTVRELVADVRAALEAVAPLLRAPAEQVSLAEQVLSQIVNSGVISEDGTIYAELKRFIAQSAPAEQGGRVDEAATERLAAWFAGNARVVFRRDGMATTADDYRDHARAALQAALAQNPQGEAVAWQRRIKHDSGKWLNWEYFSGYVDYASPSAFPKQVGRWECEYRPLGLLHAERARVPGIVNAFDKAVADELPRVSHVQFDSHEICEHFAGKVRERLLAAATQPEDAGESRHV